MKTFDDVRTAQTHARRCRVCGAPNAGMVRVQLQQRGKGSGQDKGITSYAKSFCEQHAVEVYLSAVGSFPEASA
jgi:hypothetical protein